MTFIEIEAGDNKIELEEPDDLLIVARRKRDFTTLDIGDYYEKMYFQARFKGEIKFTVRNGNCVAVGNSHSIMETAKDEVEVW